MKVVIATFKYESSTRSELPQLRRNFRARSTLSQLRLENRNFEVQKLYAKQTFAAPAGISQLFIAEVAREVNFRSSGWKIATFKYKSSTRSTLAQLRLGNRNFESITRRKLSQLQLRAGFLFPTNLLGHHSSFRGPFRILAASQECFNQTRGHPSAELPRSFRKPSANLPRNTPAVLAFLACCWHLLFE